MSLFEEKQKATKEQKKINTISLKNKWYALYKV
jgi:hypothetical protein